MKMKNIGFCLAIGFALSSQVVFAHGLRESENNFKLESVVIECVDGMPWGVDADTYKLLMVVRKEIRDRIHGRIDTSVKADPKKKEAVKKIGVYDFGGKKLCLMELVEIEDELEKNKLKYSQKEFQEIKSALYACLEIAKEDFISATRGYVKGVNGVKVHIFTLIGEFCEKKGIKECFLLKWGETEAGQEEIIIKSDVVSFNFFTQFCIDLADFLEVLAKSCPEGKKKFMKKWNIKA